MSQLGYTDTPFIHGLPYRVHESERPQPAIVAPGAIDSAAPSDAIVLFDGTSLSGWEVAGGDDAGKPAPWKLEGGYMEVTPGTGNIRTREHFGDCQLHLEFASPQVVKG